MSGNDPVVRTPESTAPCVSLRRLLGCALVFPLLLLACHLAGLREQVTALAGVNPGSLVDIVFGATYILLWFAMIVLTPPLLLAAALVWLFSRLAGWRRS